MPTQLAFSVPDETYRRAARLSALSGRSLGDILAETLTISLPQLTEDSEEPRRVADMSDADVIALADSVMAPDDAHRFNSLLGRQQEGSLQEDERAELGSLMQAYQIGLLRKAQALSECVRRGLREPLEP